MFQNTMFPPATRSMLEALDDLGFCEGLVSELDAYDGAIYLFEPWILTRLQAIYQRTPHIFFGGFVQPMRIYHPKMIYPRELLEAMHAVEDEEPSGGMVDAEEWCTGMRIMRQEGLPRGVTTGWPTLDPYYTVLPGELTVVTGIANHMKSTWVQNLCVNLARYEGWSIGLYAPEHYPLPLLGTLLAQHYTGMPMTGREIPLSPELCEKAYRWVSNHFFPIVPPEETAPTLSYLLAVARQHVHMHQLRGLVIDPWNEVDHQYQPHASETQYISRCLSQVRRFAREHHVHVWIVAHPTKMQKATKDEYAGKYPPPTPYDISGSAHWYNKPDNCLCVWRDVQAEEKEARRTIEVHVQKIRNRNVGESGDLIELHYNGTRFEAPAAPADGRSSWQV
jgi:twinkle protein